MHKSIFSWFGYVLPIQERLQMIKEADFDGTCLWWEDEIYPNHIPVRDMPGMVRDAGLILDNIHCPYEGINELWREDENICKKAIDNYFFLIEECADFAIPRMVMHGTDYNFNEKDLSKGIKAFEKLVKRAEEYDIKIAVENTEDKEIIDLLLTEIPSSHFGLCYDSSHDFIQGQSEGKLLKKWQDRLLCTHLSDNDTKEDKHWIPGDGMVEWSAIMPEICASDIEVINMELMSSKIKIEKPREYLSIAYDQINKLIELYK